MLLGGGKPLDAAVTDEEAEVPVVNVEVLGVDGVGASFSLTDGAGTAWVEDSAASVDGTACSVGSAVASEPVWDPLGNEAFGSGSDASSGFESSSVEVVAGAGSEPS